MKQFVRRLATLPFEVFIAVLATDSAMHFFFDPNATPIHALVSPVDYLWAVMYLFSGVAIVFGVGLARPDIETGGLFCFIGGIVAQAIVFAVFLGWGAIEVEIIFVAGALCALARLLSVLHGDVIVRNRPG